MPLPQSIVRQMLVATQGLARPLARPAEKADVLAAIRNMGLLQIDTIHVVARSPYLTLYSRLGDYRPEWLDELLAEGQLFEYWAHAMCFIPREDFILFRRIQLEELHGIWGLSERMPNYAQVEDQVIEHLRANGPVRSVEFTNEKPEPGGWWNWKDEKVALENLLTRGRVLVIRREKFQRVYDLFERAMPGWDDSTVPDLDTVRDELTLRAVRGLGIAHPRWAPDYYRLPKTGMAGRLARLAAEGRLQTVEVEGWDVPGYVHPERAALLDEVAGGRLVAEHTALLSPFDPLVWDRERARSLFGFDYSIECYLPAEKRKYGYFSLPILWRGLLAGRLDAKAHRKDGLMEIKSLYLEPGVSLSDALVADLGAALRGFAAWHGTPEVAVRRSEPEAAAGALAAAANG